MGFRCFFLLFFCSSNQVYLSGYIYIYSELDAVQEIIIINIQVMEVCAAKLKLITKGAGSCIYKYGQSDNAVVLKMVQCNSKQSKHLHNEHVILKQLAHQFIIAPLKFKRNVSIQNIQYEPQQADITKQEQENSSNDSVLSDVLVLEYAQCGTLMNVIRQNALTVPQVRLLFSQLCEAVEYLHCKYIVHRDLKLENVLVSVENSKRICKLADFGFASSCYNQQKLILFNSFKGTKRGYMAPQIHHTLQDSQKFYDARKSDVFALGVIMFAMLLGRLPFQYAKMQNNLYKLIVQEKYDEFWKQHDAALRKFEQRQHSKVQQFKQLFIAMVKYDPNSRVNIQDVLDSEWLNGRKQETPV